MKKIIPCPRQMSLFTFSGPTENKPKKELIQMLVRAKYDSDPVKAWKEAQKKLQVGYPYKCYVMSFIT
jgi:hypothetical protein